MKARCTAAVRAIHGRGMDPIGTAAVLLSALGFGTLATLTKAAYASGVTVPTLIAWRFGLAALLVLAVLPLEYRRRGTLLGREPWPPRRIALAALAVACFVGNTTLYLVALRSVSVTLAAVLFYAYPVLVVLLRLLGWHERPALRQCVALLLALSGVALTLGWRSQGIDAVGALLMLVSAALYAAYIVLAHSGFRDASPVFATAVLFPAVAIPALLSAHVTGTPILLMGEALVPVLAIVVFATVLPVQLFLFGSVRLGPTPAALLGTFEPIASVLIAVLALGERLTEERLVGGLLVVIAALLVRGERGQT